MFSKVKGFKKDDLALLAEEIGEIVPPRATVTDLKNLILNSDEYKKDADFVTSVLITTIAEREENKRRQDDERERQRQYDLEINRRQDDERERQRQYDLEMARIRAQVPGVDVSDGVPLPETGAKRKFHLPKLEFRQFSGDLKDWLPFWSQFEHVHKDGDIAPENKFQYLIQATVSGSRAREIVESFPPTSANYDKAVESLKTRFGREDLLVEVYVRELLKLVISVHKNEKFSLTSLYDKLESHLRALETLGVTTEKCASILYPMVESCFGEDFLKAWNRYPTSSASVDAKERLNNLMRFIQIEVEGEERITLAMSGFGLNEPKHMQVYKRKPWSRHPTSIHHDAPTAANLLTASLHTTVIKCLFCDGKHKSAECFLAQKMNLDERRRIVKEKRCCFACLGVGHTVRSCRATLRCVICSRKHTTLMCDKLDSRKRGEKAPAESNLQAQAEDNVNMANLNKRSTRVFLQTLRAVLVFGEKRKIVRLLLDSASHKSYILKKVAREMGYASLRQEDLVHSLFGGVSSTIITHNCYKICLQDLDDRFSCNFDVLDQEKICADIRPVCNGSWIKEMEEDNIFLSDVNDNSGSVDILIGADVMGRMLTGKRKLLKTGLVAVETRLGWTLMGKVPVDETPVESSTVAMSVTSLFVNELDISDLWRLDLIGITDPIEKKSKQDIDAQTREHFMETVQVNREGRYEVCLPWADDKSPLPDNLNLAQKRLESTTAKLKNDELYEKYEAVFRSWLKEGIIEEVPPTEINSYGNYLPHRPVLKPSSTTTPIRPVFDASSRLPNHPSLNQCLECGPNLIELLPDLLLRFREGKIGVIGDIRRAFCQISIRNEDREFLRFLWWENEKQKKLKYYRHTRVVFGVTCSPFLLASVIDYHIGKSGEYDVKFRKKLARSFYVDNVVTSVDNEDELAKFIKDSTALMSQGMFELREWEYSGKSIDNAKTEVHVLGLIWNKESDTLKIDMNWVKKVETEKVTKRSMLSVVHKVFDPFGYASPVMLCPKIMLQNTWKKGISWDQDIQCELRKEFLGWVQELAHLADLEVPRYIEVTKENLENCAIHTFVDGSQDAYAAVVFLRIETEGRTKIFFLASKARVSPLRGATIPRMELLAAVIGARLTNSIMEALQWKNVKRHYWSDSTTVLAWIQRDENWSVFVRNRVSEIRKLSDPSSWRHVPGEKNPADLPSRGCRAKQLLSSRWWEGPQWMKDSSEFKYSMNSVYSTCDEEEIEREKSKTPCALTNIVSIEERDWYYKKFSRYESIVRLVAWILRFKHNCVSPREKKKGELVATEFQESEETIMRMIQNECFSSENDERLKALQAFKDEKGVIRLKTKITNRKDDTNFLKPAILPSNHEVIKRLIRHTHEKNCHAGVQMILNLLREKYWILHGRRTVKRVLINCIICKRFSVKNLDTIAPPLPENRVKEAAVFQITGVDMAGPLILKENRKSWVLIFTCAVYRAVHFELVTAASTESFLMAFRRFVSRRGRCSIVYCDNGTNFGGAANALKMVDWNKVQRQGAVNTIEWKFNPPTAAWWGGFWERLIRILKDLLKRVLGRASLSYEEMLTVLADCESVINARPLTYVTEDEAIKPISPSMFLQDIQEYKLTDVDAVDRKSLNKRIKYRQTLIKDLRQRFRSEYLGTLIQRVQKRQSSMKIDVGDIVLVGADNKKRIDWPLGRISQLMRGRDGEVRLVKVQTSTNEIMRPIQRIYPLEIATSDVPACVTNMEPMDQPRETHQFNDGNDTKPGQRFSKYGRKLKVPDRLVV